VSSETITLYLKETIFVGYTSSLIETVLLHPVWLFNVGPVMTAYFYEMKKGCLSSRRSRINECYTTFNSYLLMHLYFDLLE